MNLSSNAYEFSFQKRRCWNFVSDSSLQENISSCLAISRKRTRSTIKVSSNVQIEKFGIPEHVRYTNESLTNRKQTGKSLIQNRSLVVEIQAKEAASIARSNCQEPLPKPRFVRKSNNHWKKLIGKVSLATLSKSMGPKIHGVSRQLII